MNLEVSALLHYTQAPSSHDARQFRTIIIEYYNNKEID